MECHAGLACKFTDQMRRNEIAKLPEYTELGCGWFGILFYSPLSSGRVKEPCQPLFFCFNQNSYGTAVNLCTVQWQRRTK